ncbi:hypothetical protein HDU96_001763 [Phlyctochytrium bullatum]|nr:hypothetical protein HDU96_001763 [Phlyctochytrium bullatum]
MGVLNDLGRMAGAGVAVAAGTAAGASGTNGFMPTLERTVKGAAFVKTVQDAWQEKDKAKQGMGIDKAKQGYQAAKDWLSGASTSPAGSPGTTPPPAVQQQEKTTSEKVATVLKHPAVRDAARGAAGVTVGAITHDPLLTGTVAGNTVSHDLPNSSKKNWGWYTAGMAGAAAWKGLTSKSGEWFKGANSGASLFRNAAQIASDSAKKGIASHIPGVKNLANEWSQNGVPVPKFSQPGTAESAPPSPSWSDSASQGQNSGDTTPKEKIVLLDRRRLRRRALRR